MQQSNEEKKKYLKAYLNMKKREAELEEEIAELRSRYTGRAITYSDMPKGTNESDLSDYAAEVDRLDRRLLTMQQEAIKIYLQISDAIEKLEDIRERQVLRIRYLQGIKDWDAVGDKIGYSRVHTLRIHGSALLHFNIPKKR